MTAIPFFLIPFLLFFWSCATPPVSSRPPPSLPKKEAPRPAILRPQTPPPPITTETLAPAPVDLSTLPVESMELSQLESFLTTEATADRKAQAAHRLGENALEARDPGRARIWFERAKSFAPESPFGKRAEKILAQLDSMSRVEPKTIGVVLSLTGKHANISQKTLRGIQMGLGLGLGTASSFRLALVDDEGNPDRARQGVDRLVQENNVIAIIGSLLSKTGPAVASRASALGVPSIALSQRPGLTEVSPLVFKNSLTSEMQIRHLVRMSMEELGIRRFAILSPNDAYGIEATNFFWDEVLSRGGQISAAQVYSTKEKDFRTVIQKLVGTFYIDARADEYRLLTKALKESKAQKNLRHQDNLNPLPPFVPFEAVFIPDSTRSLGQIAAMLSFNDVKNVKLLGLNLWNSPDLLKRANNWGRDLLFVDGFSVVDPTFVNSTFAQEYQRAFGELPGAFEIHGYDSALMLRQLISSGFSNRETLARALAQTQDIPGALSRLTANEDREFNRPVVALTVENGKIVPWTSSQKH